MTPNVLIKAADVYSLFLREEKGIPGDENFW